MPTMLLSEDASPACIPAGMSQLHVYLICYLHMNLVRLRLQQLAVAYALYVAWLQLESLPMQGL